MRQFTGSYSYSGFRSCIAVNPWDARGTAEAINQALTMSDEEAHNRYLPSAILLIQSSFTDGRN